MAISSIYCMKEFNKWLTEMEAEMPQGPDGGMPPVNGGVSPSVPPDVAAELSGIAEKLNALLKKLGIGKGNEEDKPEGLGDKGMGDNNNQVPGPPPSFQT